jgi:hypothetical protein
MVILADHYDYVIGGDPDRDTIDLAVIDTRTGGVQAHTTETADGAGYQRLLDWGTERAPGRRVWALEGTASFAAGFVSCLVDAGEEVVRSRWCQADPRIEERPDRRRPRGAPCVVD